MREAVYGKLTEELLTIKSFNDLIKREAQAEYDSKEEIREEYETFDKYLEYMTSEADLDFIFVEIDKDNQVYDYSDEEKEKPLNIPESQVIAFLESK